MDERPTEPPPRLPATRPAAPGGEPPPGDEPRPRAGRGPTPPKRGFDRRRFVRTPRAAAGAGLAAAFLLLWPFSGFSWIPLLVGFAALLVVRILRFDGLLRGWDLPLAGLVVVIGLMWSTSPWAWALAAAIGVLIAGLARLPDWRLAAVGAVACLIAGTGYGLSLHRTDEQIRTELSQSNDRQRAMVGESRPDLVLPAMLKALSTDSRITFCRILRDEAEAAVMAATGTPSCEAAAGELHRRMAGATYDARALPAPVATPSGWEVNACDTPWAQAASALLGKVSVFRTAPDVQRFAVSGFGPCP
ncbi:hypothetical protein SAMN05443637_1295 [Pseudonocardia thermophila]|jgi:hypothetical protein|uniref:Uncharacterized protein n=1 Tax=Pseudonocardia thermophila TaxID=1848 RepID=A0A1M7AMV1_PSETH|nr:hypothetical protein [Pseudonocardia thermophila]SHL44080.1 hypothetical protein SAMN05443637_1295 [Pseudonocardia thermophila]